MHSTTVKLLLLCLSSYYFNSVDSQTSDGTLFQATSFIPSSASHCVKIFHSKGSSGCSTPNKAGNQAVIWPFATASDVAPVLKAQLNFVAVVHYTDLTSSLVDALTAVGSNFQGIIVTRDQAPGSTEHVVSSPDVPSPQGQGTPQAASTGSATYPWNTNGQSILWAQHDFPIVLITNSTEAEQVQTRAAQNSKLGPNGGFATSYNMAFISTYMGQDKTMTSKKCMENNNCRPLGGNSVFAHIGPLAPARNVILLTTAMDSVSMFHDLPNEVNVGANAAFSSVIALLAVSSALRVVDLSALTYQLSFGIFQGEAWGFMGSEKFIQDLQSFKCSNFIAGTDRFNPVHRDICLAPLKLSLDFQKINIDSLKYVLAVDQVGKTSGSTFYVHGASGSPGSSSLVDTIVASAKTTSGAYTVSKSSSSALPPTPLTSFVKAKPLISGAVFSGYNDKFVDANYASYYDGIDNVSIDDIFASAEALVSTAITLAAGNATAAASIKVPAVNKDLVTSLYNCFLKNSQCDLIAKFSGIAIEQLTPLPLSSYVGVYAVGRQPYVSQDQYIYTNYNVSQVGISTKPTWQIVFSPMVLEAFIRNFLAVQTVPFGVASSVCPCVDGQECIAGGCVLSTSHYHDAISPGWNIINPVSFEIIGDAPAFAEPYWGAPLGPLPTLVIYYVASGFEALFSIITALLAIGGTYYWGVKLRAAFPTDTKEE